MNLPWEKLDTLRGGKFPVENIKGRKTETHQEEAPSTSRDCKTVVKVREKMVG